VEKRGLGESLRGAGTINKHPEYNHKTEKVAKRCVQHLLAKTILVQPVLVYVFPSLAAGGI
jgi:hypothetical protein